MDNINEFNEQEKNDGTIKISDEVIATIASVAVSETDGVCNLSGSLTGEIAMRFGKKNINKGIKVTTADGGTVIDISITVKYGIRIPDIAWEIQENVKKSVESMSGLNVLKVNIHVVGVEFEDEKTVTDEKKQEKKDDNDIS